MAQGVEHQSLAQHRQQRHRTGGAQHGQPVIGAKVDHDHVGHIGAHHIERPVGEVRYVQNAVHQGQTQGHQPVDAAQRQAVKHLLHE